MTYPRAQVIALLFLALTALIGFSARIFSPATEDVYPFFSWFLFVHVPQRVQDTYDVRIVAVDGKPLSAPLALAERPDVFQMSNPVRTTNNLVQKLGTSLTSRDTNGERAAREGLDAQFLLDASYELRRIRFEPIERFKTGAILDYEVLATYEVDK